MQFFHEQNLEIVSKILRNSPNDKKGTLIVFEGIDGSGKSTQTEMLVKYLKSEGHEVVETKWNSSSLMKNPIKRAKEDRILTPMLYSLMHATDMVLRYEQDILPALEANKIVVSDRYIYTSMARDEVRGVDINILKKVYADFRKPDILFHCSLPIHKAHARIIKEKGLSYYGSGMDLSLADNKTDNYVKYCQLIDRVYRKILPTASGYKRLDMDRSVDEIAETVKKTVDGKIKKKDWDAIQEVP